MNLLGVIFLSYVPRIILTISLLKYIFFVLLTLAHSFNPYAMPSTDPVKVHLLGGAEESLEKILVNLLGIRVLI